jgi:hypothetical protein
MEEDQRPQWLTWLPIFALILSVTILVFQVGVLHMWHVKLSNQMKYVTRKISA